MGKNNAAENQKSGEETWCHQVSQLAHAQQTKSLLSFLKIQLNKENIK